MINVFSWNSEFLMKQEAIKWKKHFILKYWESNITDIKNILDVDDNFLINELTSSSIFNEKKLTILDFCNHTLLTDIKNKNNIINKQAIILKQINKIPEHNILLIVLSNPDKRSKFYKELKKTIKIKEFNSITTEQNQEYFKTKYSWKIDNHALHTLIEYKNNDTYQIESELQKLYVLKKYIDLEDIKNNIISASNVNIFDFINILLNKDISKAIELIDKLHQNKENIYKFYNSIIANLRTNIYIYKLKSLNIPKTKISEILKLWNRTFLLNKSYRINTKELTKLYTKLIDLDKKMKTWKLIWTKDKDFIYELKNILLWFTC
jgi:DNA polymerase III delta subunit